MTVRRAVAGDAAALAAVHIRSWQVAYADEFEAEFLEGLDVAAREKWFERIIRQGAHVIVSDRDGVVVGFCVADGSQDDDEGEVYSIYAHPDFWDSGVGHELIVAAEESLRDRGFDRVHLWVLEGNQRARRFYESHGWRLDRPIRLEEIGGVQVTERRYSKSL